MQDGTFPSFRYFSDSRWSIQICLKIVKGWNGVQLKGHRNVTKEFVLSGNKIQNIMGYVLSFIVLIFIFDHLVSAVLVTNVLFFHKLPLQDQ